MKKYLSKVQDIQFSFKRFCITKIPKEDNEKVDCLARMASVENAKIKERREPIQNLTHSSISDQTLKFTVIEEVSNWKRELIDYLENETLPPEKKSTV